MFHDQYLNYSPGENRVYGSAFDTLLPINSIGLLTGTNPKGTIIRIIILIFLVPKIVRPKSIIKNQQIQTFDHFVPSHLDDLLFLCYCRILIKFMFVIHVQPHVVVVIISFVVVSVVLRRISFLFQVVRVLPILLCDHVSIRKTI